MESEKEFQKRMDQLYTEMVCTADEDAQDLIYMYMVNEIINRSPITGIEPRKRSRTLRKKGKRK